MSILDQQCPVQFDWLNAINFMSHLYTAGMDDKLPKLGTLKLLQISKALVEDVDQTINLPVAPAM